MRQLIYISTFVMILASCNKSGTNSDIINDNVINIKIPDDAFSSVIDLAELISEVEYIPLETNDSCIIGAINKVLSDSLYYFVHDRENDRVYQFDLQGNFVRKIGQKGKGPNEYNEIWDASLNESKKEISFLDLSGRKILRYNYDGTPLGIVPLKILGTQHEYMNNDLVMNIYKSHNKETSLNDYKLVIADSLLNVNITALPYKQNPANSYTMETPLRKFGNKVYFGDPFMNKFYRVTPDKIILEYALDVGYNCLGAEFEQLNDNEVKEWHDKKGKIYFNGEYIISDKHAFFLVHDGNTASFIYYSLDSGTMKYGNGYTHSTEKFFEKFFYSPPRWLGYDNRFISIVSPYEYQYNKELIFEICGGKLSKIEAKILNEIKLSDNQILVTYKLKEF